MQEVRKQFSIFKRLTRIEHALFGMPLMVAGALLMSVHSTALLHWLWIFPAFLAARIAGMAFNQWIDWKIDALNPRTRDRVIPSGQLSPLSAQCVAWGSLAVFLLICWQINFICFCLAPIAALLIILYSFMKRFHASCHFVLGIIHFFGPVMAALAVCPVLSLPAIFLGLAACFSITASDIYYAIQDVEFDRVQRLHSIPARLGIKRALLYARLLHVCVLICLTLVGLYAAMPLIYYLVLPTCLGLYMYFYTAKRPIESLFFFTTVGSGFSVLFFVLMGILWDAML